MFRDSLKLFERYGQNQLIVNTGQEFFKEYPDSPEILEVASAVADAYARIGDHTNEWKTYDYVLPIAAKRARGNLFSNETNKRSISAGGQRLISLDSAVEGNIHYQFLLNRYISSLTQEKNYVAVVQLYRDQIRQYPKEESLYAAFSEYLSRNQLLQEEEQVYREAISQFGDKGWYEKLARWYLRQQRDEDYEKISRQMIDLFSGTDIQSYLEDSPTGNPYEALYLGLNLHANRRFPYNIHFVLNLLQHYSNHKLWSEWESLSARYYFLGSMIRDAYLQYRAKNKTLPSSVSIQNTIDRRLAGDLEVWRSHFEGALPHYEQLISSYTSDPVLNLQVADLKRSLGVKQPGYYISSAQIREHLGKINPAEATYWTAAGETYAEIEEYPLARKDWENILAIDLVRKSGCGDPKGPSHYLWLRDPYTLL